MWDNYIALVTVGIICVASLIGLGLYCGIDAWKEREINKVQAVGNVNQWQDEIRQIKDDIEELECDINCKKASIEELEEKFSTIFKWLEQAVDEIDEKVCRLEKKINNKVEDDCK